jgi:hypothetical protein
MQGVECAAVQPGLLVERWYLAAEQPDIFTASIPSPGEIHRPACASPVGWSPQTHPGQKFRVLLI